MHLTQHNDVFCAGLLTDLKQPPALRSWQHIPITVVESPEHRLQIPGRSETALGAGGPREREVDHFSSDDITESGV